jgi:hypothetical protein
MLCQYAPCAGQCYPTSRTRATTTTNHNKPQQTTTNHNKPQQTTTNRNNTQQTTTTCKHNQTFQHATQQVLCIPAVTWRTNLRRPILSDTDVSFPRLGHQEIETDAKMIGATTRKPEGLRSSSSVFPSTTTPPWALRLSRYILACLSVRLFVAVFDMTQTKKEKRKRCHLRYFMFNIM